MSEMIAWIAAEAERPEPDGFLLGRKYGSKRELAAAQAAALERGLAAHQFPAKRGGEAPGAPHDLPSTGESKRETGEPANELSTETGSPTIAEENEQSWQERRQAELEENRERERERRIYRARTVVMLRRYLRYSMECGRLPSILGSEFFRTQVTSYRVGSFEDRVIFVHDMETCLEKLDEFSRQLIGRHILQEHDRSATARLLHCNEKTVRRFTPIALDMLSEILIDVGLLERLVSNRENSCQGGHASEIPVSDCEDGKYKF